MPTTRKKVIKTVYEDEDDSEAEKAAGDFSDSGSDAKISDYSTSEEEDEGSDVSSDDTLNDTSIETSKKTFTKKICTKTIIFKTRKFANEFINRIKQQQSAGIEEDHANVNPAIFSVKDLTDAEKQLPSFLDLSESDSSDDESPNLPPSKQSIPINSGQNRESDNEAETNAEYKDVWSNNIQDSEEVAKKTFMELEQHKAQIEETKASIQNYSSNKDNQRDSNVNDLLAQGEEMLPQTSPVRNERKAKKIRDESDSDMEDWEEVDEAKTEPKQDIQLIVDIPDAVVKKTKNVDIEMMMKRKMNKVKKEYQVYMHKVHVLCWLGHGNHVSRVLNDQDVLAAALSLMPSKECYPGDHVDMKFVKEISTWYKNKFTLNQDKNEAKFKPKAPPLKEILLEQIKSRTVDAKKYLVFIFVCMLRALGLQVRVVFNFVTLPIIPPTSQLHSLSMKSKVDSKNKAGKEKLKNYSPKKDMISQLDGHCDDSCSSDTDFENIMQLDGNDDILTARITRSTKNLKKITNQVDDVTPAKRARKNPNAQSVKIPPKAIIENNGVQTRNSTSNPNKLPNPSEENPKKLSKPSLSLRRKGIDINVKNSEVMDIEIDNKPSSPRQRITRNTSNNTDSSTQKKLALRSSKSNPTDNKNKFNSPKTVAINKENNANVAAKILSGKKSENTIKNTSSTKTRSKTATQNNLQNADEIFDEQETKTKKPNRKKASETDQMESELFTSNCDMEKDEVIKKPKAVPRKSKKVVTIEDKQRLSHKELIARTKSMSKSEFSSEIFNIIKNRVKEAEKKRKHSRSSDEESVYLPDRPSKRRNSDDDEYFKTTKKSLKQNSRKKYRPVLVLDDDAFRNKMDVWCEVFVEDLDQWIAVDVIKGKAHCTEEIYTHATHPVCYVVGWDNNNYLKDVTRRYVQTWNTVTRKQRAEPAWFHQAVTPWLAPKTVRDSQEDEQLNRMHSEAPLPKTIGEYKNHPLYALKRHLLKFEAFYPSNPATLGFVRGEAVYARDCVYVCKSRNKWFKDAKVVLPGEKPYKIVKTKKWDRVNRRPILDLPLEIFGPWQTQDYEPPTAENGIVPRNEYGNVELYKDSMLPKGTVLIKLPGLDKVAKKLNIDCAPAMIGFDNNTTWSQPLYDGFVVCKEFEEIITEAWAKDKEEQECKEREKLELRVYGNWKRLIKALFIRERLKVKYGFEVPSTSQEANKTKANPRQTLKKMKM